MIKKVDRNIVRAARHTRVRNKVVGTSSVPRLNVFRSNSNIFAQIIDDEASKTLVSASSIDKELKLENGGNVEAAVKVGELLAKRAKKAKILLFDLNTFNLGTLDVPVTLFLTRACLALRAPLRSIFLIITSLLYSNYLEAFFPSLRRICSSA